jgi:hypothetical protein
MKAYVHTPDGDYEVEANFFTVDTKGDVVTLYGSTQQVTGVPRDPMPLATVKLSAQTYIMYGDQHPTKRESEGPMVA